VIRAQQAAERILVCDQVRWHRLGVPRLPVEVISHPELGHHREGASGGVWKASEPTVWRKEAATSCRDLQVGLEREVRTVAFRQSRTPAFVHHDRVSAA